MFQGIMGPMAVSAAGQTKPEGGREGPHDLEATFVDRVHHGHEEGVVLGKPDVVCGRHRG